MASKKPFDIVLAFLISMITKKKKNNEDKLSEAWNAKSWEKSPPENYTGDPDRDWDGSATI